ncbi:MAG: glycosyltransferase family 4 protein [Blastocatellia bacterium]|nr:glycosyltransferase family 4 protein [Blastocatellia bacterium]
MKKIVILTHYFYPEKAAVGQFMTEVAIEMKRRGLDVTVLTSRATYQRTGTLSAFEVHQGVPIHRVWSTGFDKRNLVGRALNLGSFLLAATMRLLFTRRKPDLLFITNAPLLGFIGRIVHFFRGQKYICEVEDVYPDLAVQLGLFKPGSLPEKLWDALNRQAYGHGSALVTLGKRMEALVVGKLPANVAAQLPQVIIPSWADGEAIKPIAKDQNPFAEKHGFRQHLTVLYSGNLGLAHDLETLIDAAQELRCEPVLFVFIGEGGKKKILQEMVTRMGLENVRFLPYQPIEELPFSLTSADLSVVTMEAGVEGMIIPSKIYGTLAAGQAVLGLVREGSEIADILQEFQCGVTIPPKDKEAVVRLLRECLANPNRLDEMKKNARRCFDGHFRKELAMDKYYRLFNMI